MVNFFYLWMILVEINGGIFIHYLFHLQKINDELKIIFNHFQFLNLILFPVLFQKKQMNYRVIQAGKEF